MRSPHSYSAYSSYLACAAAYRACYIGGDEGLTPPALKRGSDVHTFAARYAAHCFTTKRKCDLEQGRALAAGYPGEVRELAEAFVENWRFEWGTTIVEGAAPVEQEYCALLPDRRVEFTGHLDLLQRYEGAATVEADPFGDADAPDSDGSLWVVTDFKSGLYGHMEEDTPPRQLAWYAWLVQQNYPAAQAFDLRLYSIRTNYTRSWRLSGDLSYIGVELQAIADRLAAEQEWEPCPGAACLSCLHVHACPLRDTATVSALAGISGEQALRLYLWHQGQRDALKDVLNVWLEAEGPVVLPTGDAWTETPGTPGYEVTDYSALVTLAEEADEALRTSRSKLPGIRRLLKPEKDVAAALYVHPDWHERAASCLKPRAVGKPRRGLVTSTETEAATDAAGRSEGDE